MIATRSRHAGLRRTLPGRSIPWVAVATLVGACGTEAPSASDGPYVPGQGDAWQTRAPEQVGMNSALLREAVDYALSHETTDIPIDPGV